MRSPLSCLVAPAIGALAALAAGAPLPAQDLPTEGIGQGPFRRVASFPVFLNTSVEEEAVAEIVASANRGNTLVYTDSAQGLLGFVDITDPANPAPDGVVQLPGEPTSVVVRRGLALVCVNTSADFVNVSGELVVVNVASRAIVASLPLGGQPDAIALSPSGRFAAIAIENERDEDLGSGEPPQAPPGNLTIVDLVGPPSAWTTRVVSLVGVPDLFPDDPEPEFVDISSAEIAAVTLQENNHIVLVFLPTGEILADYPAGTVDLDGIDTVEDDFIDQSNSLIDVPREPDAIAWTGPFSFVTADEGDLFGGSRGFTTWSAFGMPLFQPGNRLDQLTARIGHYPEGRSENKGCEPEGVEFGQYGLQRYLFVGAERANVVFVYDVLAAPLLGAASPVLRQILPTGSGPEGLLAIPERDLFVVACENDDRGDKLRSTLMIYERADAFAYPTVISEDRDESGAPIPFGALSGLAVDPLDDSRAYTVHDSFYVKSRIYTLDRSAAPARIIAELELSDGAGVLAGALGQLAGQLADPGDFDPADYVNADGSCNLDLEGLAVDPAGGFWVASEGAGNLESGVSDPDDRPFESPNLLLQVDAAGVVQRAVLPPLELTENQFRFGFEGVAVVGDALYVAFQRAWTAGGDPSDRARIGRYDLQSEAWSFAHYPLDAPSSPNGGWVGLSELVHLGGSDFAVIERDNQGGPDASFKTVQRFSVEGVSFLSNDQVAAFPVLTKGLVSDLLADAVFAPFAGLTPEKLEGLAVLSDGTALIVNDNDGVDDNNGETLLIELPALFR